MSYRVVIPTAGIGSRLGKLTQYLNKSLVSIALRPTISHVLELFPKDCEFVIALGHKGHLVREFLELAYPGYRFLFAEVNPFEGEGSGLGFSLLCCEKYLQAPFVFISCDTLVREPIPSPDQNWMGYATVQYLNSYRTVLVKEHQVQGIFEKGEQREDCEAYIGLAGVADYHCFWEAMRQGGDVAISQGEAYGMGAVLQNSAVAAHQFTWFDTGNPESLAQTREVYRQDGEPNILEKANEAIWFVDSQVIKFSDDRKFIANRVKRVQELAGYVPPLVGSRNNMYCYHKVDGQIMSQAVTLPLFEKLLAHCQEFWQFHELEPSQLELFQQTCLRFYRDKTLERVALFYQTFDKADATETINGEPMPLLRDLLEAVDWNWLAEGLPGRFHGDFHFENILWSVDTETFTFLDWRQDFGGDLKTGDIYYDLAKLMHGLIVCHELIANDQYKVFWNDKAITYDLLRKQILVECEQYLDQWCTQSGYDLKKVRVLTAMIYLNIAALHHYPYSLLLYALGKRMLKQEMV
jgi:choline kinase